MQKSTQVNTVLRAHAQKRLRVLRWLQKQPHRDIQAAYDAAGDLYRKLKAIQRKSPKNPHVHKRPELGERQENNLD